MNNVNTYTPTNRTLAVIDGGLNFKASVQPLATTQKPKLLDQVRQAIRTRHYSQKTEEKRSLDQAIHIFPRQTPSG